MRVSAWIVAVGLAGCIAAPEQAPEPPCPPSGETGSDHTCYPPSTPRGPLEFAATLGGLEPVETELIAAYRAAAAAGERRHQGAGPWNLRDLLAPCQVRHMQRARGAEFGGGKRDYRPRRPLAPAAERAALRHALSEAYAALRAHYAQRLRVDLETESLHAFWLRSLDLFAVTRHYLREVERDAYADDPGGEDERRERLEWRYQDPLWQGQRRVAQAFDEGDSGTLSSQAFQAGVRALEVAFTCPLLPGESAADVSVRLAAVRRRRQLEALEAPRAAGGETLDAALQATLDAERARDGADRIDALRDQLETEWVEPQPRRRPRRTD